MIIACVSAPACLYSPFTTIKAVVHSSIADLSSTTMPGAPMALFERLPTKRVLTLNMDVPEAWLVEATQVGVRGEGGGCICVSQSGNSTRKQRPAELKYKRTSHLEPPPMFSMSVVVLASPLLQAVLVVLHPPHAAD